MMRNIVIGIMLLAATTILSVGTFRLHHRDYFYLRAHHLTASEAQRDRIMRIARRVDFKDKRNAAISMMLAEALMNLGETRSALEIVEQQVRLHPEDLGILQSSADMLARAGRQSEADIRYRRLLTMIRLARSKEQGNLEGPR